MYVRQISSREGRNGVSMIYVVALESKAERLAERLNDYNLKYVAIWLTNET